MLGYCLVCKKKVEFTPTKTKKLKNGLTVHMGKDKYGHTVSVIKK